MKLTDPVIITPRLLPGVKIGDDFISIKYGHYDNDGRMCYVVYFDIAGKEFLVDDLKSGCQGGTLQEGLYGLMSFLGAAAESHDYWLRTKPQGENEDLFCPEIVEWAYQHDGEIAMMDRDLETPDLIQE